jgi:hypothetical protein
MIHGMRTITMKTMTASPEWQAREDWRAEGVFHPDQYRGTAANRYRREAGRIERENAGAEPKDKITATQGGRRHGRAIRH